MSETNPIEEDPNCIEHGEPRVKVMTRNKQIRLPYEDTSYGRSMSQKSLYIDKYIHYIWHLKKDIYLGIRIRNVLNVSQKQLLRKDIPKR